MESVTVYRGDEDESFRLTDRTAEAEKSLWLNSKKEIDSPAALT